MPRIANRLTALQVQQKINKKLQGMHADGAGLYLSVSASGSASWIFRYMLHGKNREMGLGAVSAINLTAARDLAAKQRTLLAQKIDPLAERDMVQKATRLAAAKTKTFAECAASYIAAHQAGWRNAKHAAQWQSTLATYAYPIIGNLSVQDIDTGLILKIVEPIWQKRTETATRVRGRTESVLDWATARGYRVGENPARWRGHLQNLLPKPTKIKQVKHHPALPYAEVASFMAKLHTQPGYAAQALELTILTAARSNEVLGARWEEVDLQAGLWTKPASRTKANMVHRVPLAPPAIALLKKLHQLQSHAPTEFIFPSEKSGRHLSNTSMLMLLRRMNSAHITVHGFRSTFRDWAAECTNYPREVAEASMAHKIGSKVELAYLRSDFFEKRRRLMAEWAKYCYTPANQKGQKGNVVKLGVR